MLIEALKELQSTQAAGVRFADGKGNLKRLSYQELVETAKRFADGLLRKGVHPGEPVILVMTNPESAIVAILGCMIAGCPPTPVYPPMNATAIPGFLKFVEHVAGKAQATAIVSDPQPFAFLGNVPHQAETIRKVHKFEAILNDAKTLQFSDGFNNPVAFLQFTSGSTSAPKGVVITHQGLMANLQMIRKASQMSESSCVVTWLPVYHDMGLIGTVLNAITLPCDLVVIPPVVFLKKPRLWLELITQFRGTHTAAPNFAYGLCTRRVADTGGLDLSSMTTFICGAEPVLAKTMNEFVSHYRSAGLHPGALVPAYGLAEATLAVTFSSHMRGLAVDPVDFDALSTRNIAESTVARKNVPVASCGVPMDGVELRIASENGNPLPDRHVGEIQIKGVTVTPGYVGDEEATRNSRTPDGWLRTGDLGYIAEGELYPCGRIKDLIIIRGKNFHAHDLESITSEVSGIRTGNVVAFGIQEPDQERLIIVAETRREGETMDLARDVRAHIAQSIGISPDDVVIVPSGTLPKTSSGKLKRFETRKLYQAGRLHLKPGKFAVWQAALESGLGFLKGRLKS